MAAAYPTPPSAPSNHYQRRSTFPWRVILFYLFIIPLLLVWLVPLFTAVITSVRSLDSLVANGPWSIPREIEWGNFKEAWLQGSGQPPHLLHLCGWDAAALPDPDAAGLPAHQLLRDL